MESLTEQEGGVKYVTLQNYRKNQTVREFVERTHIFFTDPDHPEDNMDDVVKNFFKLNKERIFEQMDASAREDFSYYKSTGSYPTKEDREDEETFEENACKNYPTSADDLDENMILPYPCLLRIGAHCITSELMISQTNFQMQDNDVFAFADEHIQEILSEAETSDGAFAKSEPKVTAFLWSKTLTKAGINYQIGGLQNHKTFGWADLSARVVSMSTSVGQQGGTFNLRLAFIASERYRNDWVSKSLETNKLLEKYGNISREADDYYTDEHSSRTPPYSRYSRVNFNTEDAKSLFSNLISPNDLFFIAFSSLEDESDKADLVGENIEANYEANNIAKIASESSFDMIGLVDNVTIQRNAENSSIIIDVTGRDLSKLLSDDGTFFFNYSTTKNPSRIFYNEQGYAKQGDVRDVDKMDGTYQAINRMRRTANELDIFCNQTNQSIDYIIKGVLSQLANIEIVPSTTFEYWENRTRWLDVHPEDEIKDKENPKSEIPEISTDEEPNNEDRDLDKIVD